MQNSNACISSNLSGSPHHHQTINFQKESFNMEIKLCSSENVKVEVQFEEDDGIGDKENCNSLPKCESVICNEGGLREDAKKRLQRLGKLYSGGDDANISSPIHRTESTFLSTPEKPLKIEKKDKKHGLKGLGGLAALAQDINKWEDAVPTIKANPENNSSKRSWKPPAPRPPITSTPIPSTQPNNKNPCKVMKSKAPQPPKVEDKAECEPVHWDKAVLDTLESQGFQRTSSDTRLVYNYNNPKKLSQHAKDCVIESNEEITTEVQKAQIKSSVKYNLKGVIANKAAIFENNSSPNKTNKDPALLSLSERKALFEKNKGEVLIPKAPIGMPAPVHIDKRYNIQSSESKQKSLVKSHGFKTTSPITYTASQSPIKKIPNVDESNSSAYRVAPGESGGIASKVAALFQNKATISQQQIQNDIKQQRQKEMDVLLHRFQKNKNVTIPNEVSDSESENGFDATETTAMIDTKHAEILKDYKESLPPPSLPPACSSAIKKRSSRSCIEDSPKVTAALEDVKRIKVSPAKPGKIYPCLSDIEATTETENEQNTGTSNSNSSYEDCFESDLDGAETSFGREILQTVCKNQTPQKRPIYDGSSETDMSDILDEMDDYLDEALAYECSDGPTPPKYKRSTSPIDNAMSKSNSFQYKNCSPNKLLLPNADDIFPSKKSKTPVKNLSPNMNEECPSYVVEGDAVLPLTHTVSFYRKQQIQGPKTPVKQVIKYSTIQESKEDTVAQEENEVQNKIRVLLNEISKQQTIISQTSQALNLCYSTPEFTGSTEQVEAEKVLLLATQRRGAAQREIERLSVLKTLHMDNKFTENIPLEKGKLTISNIVLPLKREYVRALNATGGKGHHVVCLINCADQVHVTQLVSTVATNDRNPNLELNIPGTIQLNDIYSNFTAQLEVYCLQAQNESVPHEVKYHINKKVSSRNTPKKGKAESRLIRPPKESPGGPLAVRSPTFALMGYVVFSIQAIKRKNWTLNNAPSMSPLEGIVEMRVKCELAVTVEHWGFLTMFKDVSGFGAWHRRWCLLKDQSLSYWKYPGDEIKKAPIDTIDLTTCITQLVKPVRTDICARLNTFLIETKRHPQPHDSDSLVMQCNADYTIIRHLLSADTKEERNEWCSAFNKALTAINMLGNCKQL
ncbi:hypothetical protein FQA39_LY14155 [Lamprigera yunnana]|nr:hypothetical protein FQA39_LY14155 [Lamprigera yunnana]